MLAMDCDGGYHMEAADEEQLFGQAREHVDRDHLRMVLTDEELRGILAEGAYTKQDRQIAYMLTTTRQGRGARASTFFLAPTFGSGTEAGGD